MQQTVLHLFKETLHQMPKKKISMVIKSYIYRKRCLNETLTIQGLLLHIRTHLTTVKYLVTKKGKSENFNRKWQKWLFFLK